MRFYRLHIRTAAGTLRVTDYPGPRRDGTMSPAHIADCYTELEDSGREVQFEIDDEYDRELIGIRSSGSADPKILDGSFASPPRRRVYRCWECQGRLTRRDARVGVVAIVVPTETGCVRKTVHQWCENAGELGLF